MTEPSYKHLVGKGNWSDKNLLHLWPLFPYTLQLPQRNKKKKQKPESAGEVVSGEERRLITASSSHVQQTPAGECGEVSSLDENSCDDYYIFLDNLISESGPCLTT